MKKQLISYVRLSVCSISAIAVASCARMNGSVHADVVEPLRSDAPEDLLQAHLERGRLDWEEQRIDALESELQSVNHELKGLRQALEMMGPLDNVADAGDSLLQPAIARDVMDQAPDASPLRLTKVVAKDSARFDLSDIYATPPGLSEAQSIFHGVRLAQYQTKGAAEADWARLSVELDLEGLEPRFEDAGNGVRLFAGPFTNYEGAAGLCFDLAPVAGACEAAAFQGVLN